METIYIETTVVSYLVANPSRDSILAAHQQLTRQWWQDERQRYQCVTSREVLREASLGDAEMSRRRAEALAGLTVLAVEDSARGLARAILAEKLLPPAAASYFVSISYMCWAYRRQGVTLDAAGKIGRWLY